MRPPHRYRLKLKLEPQSEDRSDQFRHALHEFIEVLARSEIEKLRTKAPTPPTLADQPEGVGELQHLVPKPVGSGTQSK